MEELAPGAELSIRFEHLLGADQAGVGGLRVGSSAAIL